MANSVSASPSAGKLWIEVFGTNVDGRQFCEQTRTQTITRDGAVIALTNKLAPDSEFVVRNPVTNEEGLARVVDLIKDALRVHTYGIAFLDPSVNLWQSELPPRRPQELTNMECDHCHAVDVVLLSEIEAEIFELKKMVSRYCACAHSSTIWRQTDRTVTERPATEQKPAGHARDNRRQRNPPAQESTTQVQQERRSEKRTPMKVSACIQCRGEEVIVECEDLSRGGLRFKSRKRYSAGMPIKVAVPYLKNSLNIFVTAQIAYQQELPNEFYRYGVTYVKSRVELVKH